MRRIHLSVLVAVLAPAIILPGVSAADAETKYRELDP